MSDKKRPRSDNNTPLCTRPSRAARVSHTSRLQDLPPDLYDTLLTYLPLPGLHALRQAGLGSSSSWTWARPLRMEMRRRIAVLRRLHDNWSVRHDKDTILTPTEFTLAIDDSCFPDGLGIRECDSALFSLVGRDVPGITSLRVCVRYEESFPGPVRLSSLPWSLARCQQVTKLNLRHHTFRTLPKPILALRGLTHLFLSCNPHLMELPEDIGVRLSRLELIEVCSCPLRKLPESLLCTLERNHPEKEDEEKECQFGVCGFSGERISPKQFPRLARCRVRAPQRQEYDVMFQEDG